MASMDDLPPNILAEIFIRSDLKSWIKSLPFVCTTWNDVMAVHVWPKVDAFIHDYNKKEGKHILGIGLSNGRQSFLAKPTNFGDISFMYFVNRFKFNQLKSLQVETFIIALESISIIGVNFANLRKLNLRLDSNKLESIISAINCLTDLVEIRVEVSPQWMSIYARIDDVVRTILTVCKALRVVDFNIIHLQNTGILTNLDGLSNLEEFHWKSDSSSAADQTAEILSYLSRCSNGLRSVSIFCVHYRSRVDALDMNSYQNSMIALAKKQIRQFSFGLPAIVDTRKVDEILSPLADFRVLKSLTLKQTLFSPNTIPLPLGDRLESLKLDFCKITNDSYFSRFAYGMQCLETLQIDYSAICNVHFFNFFIGNLLDFVLKCFALKRLELLDLRYCVNKFDVHFLSALHKKFHNECTAYRPISPNVESMSVHIEGFIFADGVLSELKKLCGLKIEKFDSIQGWRSPGNWEILCKIAKRH